MLTSTSYNTIEVGDYIYEYIFEEFETSPSCRFPQNIFINNSNRIIISKLYRIISQPWWPNALQCGPK